MTQTGQGSAPKPTEAPATPPTKPSAYLLRLAVLGLLYPAFAWIPQLVGEVTGYASPLWPAAGIALAGLVAWGLRCWPGVWIGGALTALWMTPSGSGLLLSALMASGIALQAVVGAWLAEQYLRHRNPVVGEAGLLLFLLAAGPLASIISSSFGLFVLASSGAVQGGGMTAEWLRWWAGDTIGVLLVAPLALAIWPGVSAARLHWEGGWRVAMVSAVTAALLFIVLAPRGTESASPTLLAAAVAASLLIAFALLSSAGRTATTTARIVAGTEELRSHEAERHAVLDNLVECVITIDSKGIVRNVNRAVETMFGYAQHEVVGQNVSLLMGEADGAAHDAHIGRYLGTGERRIIGRNREVEGRHKDGHAIALELSVSEYVSGEQRVFTGTLRDISERKALVADLTSAREQADEANRAKSAFLAAMSHEIRTPMNGVVGLVDVLARSDLTEYQRELVRTVRESSSTLMTLIDDILDFSKIEAGRLDIEQRPVSLVELVEGVCASLAPQALRRGVDVSLFISPDVPCSVLSDEVRLRQILYNLVGNAIKFSAGRPNVRGTVAIRVTHSQREPVTICFRIADNGIGIAPDRLNDLFRPFTQAESSTTRRYGGTGLGLAICKRLASLLNGVITVESAVGKGSTFAVTLPLTPDPAPAAAATAAPDLGGLDCVVSPCCAPDAEALTAYLQHAGARVHVPADQDAAGMIASEASTPIIVLDCSRDGLPPPASLLQPRPGVRTVRIVRGRQGTAGAAERNDVIRVDGNVLRQGALLRAVAIAAGRASPDAIEHVHPDEMDDFPGQAPSITEACAQGRLILVAEDNQINQKVILRQLTLLGLAAEIAEDGVEALEKWRTGHYALLLTDLHMPRMDGYALASTIRDEELGPVRKPILALTANALRGEERRALDAGMDAYLTKPIRLEQLKATLEHYLPPAPPALHASQPAAPSPPGEESPPLRNEAAAAPIFDVSVLEELVGDDQLIVREFVDEFRRTAADLADALRVALDGGWVREAGNAAHKLKSAARSVGALALGEQCAALEQAARQEDAEFLVSALPAFNTLLQDTDARIAGFLESDQAALP